jgi:hypothetical protein
MHRGVNQTTASLKIITYDGGSRRETNNSPMNNKRVLMYEGDDNYANVSAMCHSCRYKENVMYMEDITDTLP